ncbi:MAG: FIST N-terminal domain-containing protein [Microcystaceae cyanobacterium]
MVMQWVNALSTRPSLEAAVNEVVGAIQAQLSAPPQLGIVFLSSTFASDYPRLVPLLLEKLPLPVLLGCGGAGIIGMKGTLPLEIEQTPALSLMVASLPEVTVQPFQINPDQLPDLDSPPQHWWELLEVAPEHHPHFLLLCDPMTSGLTDLLAGLDFAYPQAVKIGGVASGNVHPSSGNLFFLMDLDRFPNGIAQQQKMGMMLRRDLQ